jgi:AraC-like DNA-binding protein
MVGVHDAELTRSRRRGSIPQVIFQSGDPDQITEALAPTTPGSRIEALSRRPFDAKIRTWRFPRTGLLTIEMIGGQAVLPGDRNYASLTVASAGVCLARDDPRTLTIEGDAAHFLDADEPTEFRPSRRSRVLAANLDTSLLVAHMGRPGAAPRRTDGSQGPLLSPSAERNSVRRFFGWVFEELNRADSSLHDLRVATEVESVLAAMLAEACASSDAPPALPSEHRLRRAEEFLAASVSRSVSLAEVAGFAGVSVRTLTRGFRIRHGLGPIGFLHRHRLEAARRELRAASPDEATVTEVAHRYCFAHTGRFAIAYRRAFGESPSMTLRRSLGRSRRPS